MVNELNFEGYIDKITLKNSQVLKFTVINCGNKRTKKITATVFNGGTTSSIYQSIESLVGRLVMVVGEIYESSYKDKVTNEWVNTYCIQVNRLVERKH